MFCATRAALVRLPLPTHITPAAKNNQTVFVGTVVSDAMQKTVKVAVPRDRTVRKLNTEVVRIKNFKAHDEFELCRPGDTVQIRACRPLSKTKAWIVDEILKQAPQFDESIKVDLDAKIAEISTQPNVAPPSSVEQTTH
jgi:small subunit ribosomal protein S17